jgi:hypothetical protein
LRIQFREFLRRLEACIEDVDEVDLKSIEIFKIFLSSSKKLYVNVELIVHIIWKASYNIMSEQYNE